jgi:deglycase
MAEQRLDGMRVAILVADDFEQVEMTEPRKALDGAGARTTLVSPVSGQVHGMKHDVKQDAFKVEMSLDQADPQQFDAVMLPGGALNADFLRVQPKAQQFVKAMQEAGKPFAVICHAPWLLVSAGLTRGRTLTSYHTIQDDIRNSGANWVDREVVRDQNWVTSRQPNDIPAFNREMLGLFSEHHGTAAQRRAA